MAEFKPLKLTDLGGGAGKLEEFGAGETLPAGSLPANVAALAGLTGVADRLPYFTGAGALSLATLTAKARSLLASADEAAMRAFLQLVKQTAVGDVTAGSLLINGAHGLGGTAVSLTSIDLNGDLATGFYYCSSCTNSPAGNGWLLVEKLNSSYAYQTFSSVGANSRYIRFNSSGTWQPWIEQLGAGSYGLGGRVLFKSGRNLNSLVETGFTTESNPTNAPVVTTTNLLNLYNPDGSGRSLQLAQTVNSEDCYLRSQNTGAWSTWKKLFHQGSILGTVTQSGGVPTGAVIERGSNANGEYTKFADGTMICTKSPPVGDFGAATAYGTGGLYRYLATWTFPAAFTNMPACSGCGVDQAELGWLGGGSSGTGTSASLAYFSKVNGLTSTSIKFLAIGRWF